MGILIAIDGTDASGKQTQSELLYKKLTEKGIRARLVSFPAYDKESSALVKMYLAGAFGTDPSDVNAYAASVLYAADRFATYRTDWGRDHDDGVVIIADRYVSSNMIHQASKCGSDAEKDKFIAWLEELEYGHFGLPRPCRVLFLDMPPQVAAELMRERANKIDSSQDKDIHERNAQYLQKSYENAQYISRLRGWTHISCVRDGRVRDIEDISNEVTGLVMEMIGSGDR